MELELYGADEKLYGKLDQEDALLGSYPVDDGCRIHVRPPDLGSFLSIYLTNACRILPYVIAKIGPHGASSSVWRETDPSLDSVSQSGLAGASPGYWGHPEEVPDSIWDYQKGLSEGRDA